MPHQSGAISSPPTFAGPVLRPSPQWWLMLGAVVIAGLISMSIGFSGGGWTQAEAEGIAKAVMRAESGATQSYAVCVTVALRNQHLSPSRALTALAGHGPYASAAAAARESCRSHN